MSHITIIISRAPAPTSDSAHEHQPSYEYAIPVPHDATPAQVGDMVRKAFKRLEGADD
jgi:hypothetical protein